MLNAEPSELRWHSHQAAYFSRLQIPVIDDADDRGVGRAARRDRRETPPRGRARRTRSRRRRRRPNRAPRASGPRLRPRGKRLQHEQLQAGQVRRPSWSTTTSPMTRASCMSGSAVVHLDGVDDADDGGVDRAVLQARRHARRAAADDQHRLADAGVDGVDRDEVVAFGLAAADPSAARRAACC